MSPVGWTFAPEFDARTHDFRAEDWLTTTLSQLTGYGLTELHAQLKDGEVGVLFRNNHFSTIYKRVGELLALVTDEGYRATPAVWETLAEDGNSVFLDQHFQPLSNTGDTHLHPAVLRCDASPAAATAAAAEPEQQSESELMAEAIRLQQMYDERNANVSSTAATTSTFASVPAAAFFKPTTPTAILNQTRPAVAPASPTKKNKKKKKKKKKKNEQDKATEQQQAETSRNSDGGTASRQLVTGYASAAASLPSVQLPPAPAIAGDGSFAEDGVNHVGIIPGAPAISSWVVVHSIEAKPELNGTTGKVEAHYPDTGRCGIRLSTGEIFGLKPANLRPAPPRQGHSSLPGTTSRIAGRGDVRPGDWTCPSCNGHNFASRVECRRCGDHKPASSDAPPRKVPVTDSDGFTSMANPGSVPAAIRATNDDDGAATASSTAAPLSAELRSKQVRDLLDFINKPDVKAESTLPVLPNGGPVTSHGSTKKHGGYGGGGGKWSKKKAPKLDVHRTPMQLLNEKVTASGATIDRGVTSLSPFVCTITISSGDEDKAYSGSPAKTKKEANQSAAAAALAGHFDIAVRTAPEPAATPSSTQHDGGGSSAAAVMPDNRKERDKTKEKERSGGRKGPGPRPEDWLCPAPCACKNYNFESRMQCRRCGAARGGIPGVGSSGPPVSVSDSDPPPDHSEEANAARRTQLEKQLGGFAADVTRASLTFPTTLNSFERHLVHELSIELGLLHESAGGAGERTIVVWKKGTTQPVGDIATSSDAAVQLATTLSRAMPPFGGPVAARAARAAPSPAAALPAPGPTRSAASAAASVAAADTAPASPRRHVPAQQRRVVGAGTQAVAVRNSLKAAMRAAHIGARSLPPIPLPSQLSRRDEALRDDQIPLFNEAVSDDGNVIVCAGTGFGKTRVGFEVVAAALRRHPTKRVVFLCPTFPLADQQQRYWDACTATSTDNSSYLRFPTPPPTRRVVCSTK